MPFAGLTGLVEGEEGQRAGDVVWIRSDDKGQRVLLGRAREDVQLCGRPTLLEPRRLDAQGRVVPVKVQQLSLDERRTAPVLEARATSGPTPGGNPLRALAASSAIGDGTSVFRGMPQRPGGRRDAQAESRSAARPLTRRPRGCAGALCASRTGCATASGR